MKKNLCKLLSLLACGLLAVGLSACNVYIVDTPISENSIFSSSSSEEITESSSSEENSSSSEENSSSSEEEISSHEHNYQTMVTNPTCEAMGYTTYTCECGDTYKNDYVSKLDHTLVLDEAVGPTCTQTGLTAGYHCDVCKKVIIAQEILKVSDHTEIIDPAKTPTCTETGLTQGKHCDVCGEIIIKQELIPETGHSYKTTVTNSTCSSQGFTTFICGCGDSYIGNYTESLPHPYDTKWVYDETHHWHNTTCGCEIKIEYEEHNFVNNTCSVCRYSQFTEGVLYRLSDDGTYAEVYDYVGTATDVAIADTYEGKPVSSIGDLAFWSCRSLTSISIPDSVSSIGYRAFLGCISLTNIEVAESNSAYMDIDGNLYTKDGTILIQYAIGKTDTSFTIPDSVTEIGDEAFRVCSRLTSITIPDSVSSIANGAFEYCISVTSITIPDSVTSIGNYAFCGCRRLTSVTIPDSITSIGNSAFSDCSSLQYNEKDGLKYLGNENNPYLYLADTVNNFISTATIDENCRFIGDAAFAECSRLTSITIPNSVTFIGNYVFTGCSSLAEIKFEGTVEQWNAFGYNDWDDVPATKVICSDGKVDI